MNIAMKLWDAALVAVGVKESVEDNEKNQQGQHDLKARIRILDYQEEIADQELRQQFADIENRLINAGKKLSAKDD